MAKILILNSHLDTSHESVYETDNATPTTTTCPCANDFQFHERSSRRLLITKVI